MTKKEEREKTKKAIDTIVSSIQDFAAVGRQLAASNLETRVIVLLLRDMTDVGVQDIERILGALPRLGDKYLKSPAVKHNIDNARRA